MTAVWDRIDAELVRRRETWADLGRRITATDQTMHNWKQRGVPAKRYKAIAAALDMTVDQLISEHWTPEQTMPAGVVIRTVDRDMSHPEVQDAPITIAWEQILIEQLKPEFQTVMPDASMEPDVPRGAKVIFLTAMELVPGDWVLCKDGEGNLYLREMRQIRPGRWEAHAINPAFLPMDSERDRLVVLAVFDGVRGRKGRA